MEEPLVNKEFLLQKSAGKGGWTYALIPEILQNKKAYFGLVKVRGSIDGYAIEKATLMPIGAGKLMLPVKAAIRKSIGKEAGDRVHLILFAENPVSKVREELLLCLEDEPAAHKAFLNLPAAEQQLMTDWIATAKNEDAKVERIAQAIDKLMVQLLKGKSN